MQLIYYLPAIWIVGISTVKSQLLYTDLSRDDGPCTYPAPVPLIDANLLINPLREYYIPVASENFYRFEYQMALSKPAQTEDDISALKVMVQLLNISDVLQHLSIVTVYFFGNRDINYSYRSLPSAVPISLDNPIFNITASTVHGSSGSAYSNYGGLITFTIIWNDNSPAWNLWTCVGGRQMFHIITGAKSLTEDQLNINIELLTRMGFNTSNFHYLNYD